MSDSPPFIDAEAVRRLLPMADAIDAVESALRDGLDPEADPPRVRFELPTGHLLLMPSSAAARAGVKVGSVAPGNAARGLPRIHGVYALFDLQSLVLLSLIDGAALTKLRTPAVSAVAVRHLAAADARRLVIFGTGVQAWGHIEALRAVRPIERVDIVGRDPARSAAFVERCLAAGVPARAADRDVVAEADLVCCCTTAREPLFDGRLVRDGATVVAVGSHEPAAREVDEALVGRSTVVVEAHSSALREAGDIIQAIRAGVIADADLRTIDALVRGEVDLSGPGPRLYKSTGMAWQDLVVATAIHARRDGSSPTV